MKEPLTLVNKTTDAPVSAELEVADGHWSRFWGLQFRRVFPPGAALLLVPCSSIHTFWLRFHIDVVMLDRSGRVLAVRTAVPPWRMVIAPKGTHAILEMPARQNYACAGDQLRLLSREDRPFPASLDFLRNR